MATIISKSLAVFTSVASVAFLGFVGAMAVGGPNWKAESDTLTGFVFEKGGDSVSSWSVKARRPGNTFSASNALLPEAIVKARTDLKQQQLNDLKDVSDEIPLRQAQLNESLELVEIDEAAIQKCIDRLKGELKALNKEIDKVSLEGIETSQQAQAIKAELYRRREEVFRLKNQFEEILVDIFQAKEQQKRLRDEKIQVEGNIELLARREKQLLEAGAAVKPNTVK